MSERTPYDAGDRTGADVPTEATELVDLAAVARDDALVEALRRRAPRRELDRLDGFAADPVAGLLAALAADVDLLAGLDRDADRELDRLDRAAAGATPGEALTSDLSRSADRSLGARLPSARSAVEAPDAAEVAAPAAEVLPLRHAGAGRVARGSRRAGAAAVVVAGLVSVSGVAAALTGDPLAPYVGVARGIAEGISHGVAAVTSGGSATADGRRPQPLATGVPSGRPDSLPSALASGMPVGSPAATAAQLDAGLAEVDRLVAQGRDADAAAQLRQLQQLLGTWQGALPADQVSHWHDRIDALQQTLAGTTGRPTDAGKPTGAGRPSDAGRPSEAGRPSDAGRPSNAGKPTARATPPSASPTTGQHGKPSSTTGTASSTATSSTGTGSTGTSSSTATAPAPQGTATATATLPGNGAGHGAGNGNGKGRPTGSAHGAASVATGSVATGSVATGSVATGSVGRNSVATHSGGTGSGAPGGAHGGGNGVGNGR